MYYQFNHHKIFHPINESWEFKNKKVWRYLKGKSRRRYSLRRWWNLSPGQQSSVNDANSCSDYLLLHEKWVFITSHGSVGLLLDQLRPILGASSVISTVFYWSKQLWGAPRLKRVEKQIPSLDKEVARPHCRIYGLEGLVGHFWKI